ncbi:MAG: RHS repeat-associated core domain-containing protein, partial [Clostridia bacterium]|nr:RHS repeat-associated core domain-containing protein [Clostridia bacterium]
FTYDAWGNFTTNVVNSTVCTLEFLIASLYGYRGYIYDYELGLYYLQSRYYDPETGRFISADGYVNANGVLVGYNMYAYCSNNPVMYVDPTGDACHCLFERAHPRHKCEDFLVEINSYQDYIEYRKALVALGNTKIFPKERDIDSDQNTSGKRYFVVDASIDLRYSQNQLTGKALDYYAELLYLCSIEASSDISDMEVKLMSISHIKWEYKVHYYTKDIFENSMTADLNVEETWGTLIKRVFNKSERTGG